MSQAQRCVSGDRALAVHDRRDAIRRNLEATRELRGAHVERIKLLSQVFSGVNSLDAMMFSSVIIDNLDMCRARRPIGPLAARYLRFRRAANRALDRTEHHREITIRSQTGYSIGVSGNKLDRRSSKLRLLGPGRG